MPDTRGSSDVAAAPPDHQQDAAGLTGDDVAFSLAGTAGDGDVLGTADAIWRVSQRICVMRAFESHPRIPRSVANFLREVAALPDVEALVLFGSRAFGDGDERSDVDIAVIAANLSRLDWARLRIRAYEAHSLFWISLTHFESNPEELKRRILQTGELIHVAAETTRQFGEFRKSDHKS